MADEDDAAWKEWTEATDHLIQVQEVYREFRALPDKDVSKQRAWIELQLAVDAVNEAATKIAPPIQPQAGPI
jgi:hypothetical protein